MSEVEKYVANRTMRLNTPYSIINGVGYYDLDGKILTAKQFDKKYPLKPILKLRMDNVDTTKLWMNL